MKDIHVPTAVHQWWTNTHDIDGCFSIAYGLIMIWTCLSCLCSLYRIELRHRRLRSLTLYWILFLVASLRCFWFSLSSDPVSDVGLSAGLDSLSMITLDTCGTLGFYAFLYLMLLFWGADIRGRAYTLSYLLAILLIMNPAVLIVGFFSQPEHANQLRSFLGLNSVEITCLSFLLLLRCLFTSLQLQKKLRALNRHSHAPYSQNQNQNQHKKSLCRMTLIVSIYLLLNGLLSGYRSYELLRSHGTPAFEEEDRQKVWHVMSVQYLLELWTMTGILWTSCSNPGRPSLSEEHLPLLQSRIL